MQSFILLQRFSVVYFKIEKLFFYVSQGLMFGYATDETEECMPLTVVLSHKLNAKLSSLRRSGELSWARPDTKTQVSILKIKLYFTAVRVLWMNNTNLDGSVWWIEWMRDDQCPFYLISFWLMLVLGGTDNRNVKLMLYATAKLLMCRSKFYCHGPCTCLYTYLLLYLLWWKCYITLTCT